MYTKNNGSGENNVIQNRFTAYLLTAIHRKKSGLSGCLQQAPRNGASNGPG